MVLINHLINFVIFTTLHSSPILLLLASVSSKCKTALNLHAINQNCVPYSLSNHYNFPYWFTNFISQKYFSYPLLIPYVVDGVFQKKEKILYYCYSYHHTDVREIFSSPTFFHFLFLYVVWINETFYDICVIAYSYEIWYDNMTYCLLPDCTRFLIFYWLLNVFFVWGKEE